ncbi:cytochrome c family protein [Anthocerotibacter panamensis]|uniref:hypothetical protein n=1 Tax=Anthocerotibacter panamensis TaxID=2857077 RepID=UPI001FD94274|nr:hypothetical protein [Anthocerotibacter panamensis]
MLWLACTLGAVALTACSSNSDQTQASTPTTEAAAFVAKADLAGKTTEFSRDEMKQGFRAFKAECSKCHVGGQTYGTYNVREINLSLEQLKGATPPLDNIETLISYMKKPLSYDGTENLYDGGRHPKFDNLPEERLTAIAAHILKEANFNKTWGKGKDVR